MSFHNRRTFAIISHPDAGKTTLTEKLLLYGGAIQMAGDVRARGERRLATSDWMNIEKQRGISVTASAMCFEYGGCVFNLLDTPGHEDFSEDTYRTLTAVDSAVMVIDAARGIEAQTRKLFEVCRLRDVPVMVFVNKMDREARDPFEILDEVAQDLALDVSPITWPVGQGRSFRGVYSFERQQVLLMDRGERHKRQEGAAITLEDLQQGDYLERASDYDQLCEQLEIARELLPELVPQSYEEGHMAPVFFGSALWSFGVAHLLDALVKWAPSPRPQATQSRIVQPDEKKVSGYVFKIQANMDARHRDRIAFLRLMSGKFRRGMKLYHTRSGKMLTVSNPMLFLAQERATTDEAEPGDILGIPNHGSLRVGDTLTEGEKLHMRGIPVFAPEMLQSVRSEDPLKGQDLHNALVQFSEEGLLRLFRTEIGSRLIAGVVGRLQFDVLKERMAAEYKIPVAFEGVPFITARWVVCQDKQILERFCQENRSHMATDSMKNLVFLPRSSWDLTRCERDYPEVILKDVIDLINEE